MDNEKILLNVEETAEYLNLGKTKTRQLMKDCLLYTSDAADE